MLPEEENFDTGSLDTKLWFKIIKLLTKSKKNLYAALAFISIEAVIGVMLPLFNRHAIDVYASGIGTNQDILYFSLFYLFVIGLQAYVIYRFVYHSGMVELEVSYYTRNDIMEKLQNLSFSYFDVTPSGWIIARLTSDISQLSEILSWALIDLVWGFAMMIMLVIVMFSVNVKLALVVVIVVPFVYLVSGWFQKHILINYRKSRAVNSKITGAYAEGVSGAQTTKTMALEHLHYGEFTALTTEMKEKTMRAILLNSMYVPIVSLLSALGSAGVIWIGGEMVLNDVIAVGTLFMFTQYANSFFEPLRNISGILAQLQMAQASAERVLSLLETESSLVDSDEVIEKYGTILEPNEAVYEPITGDVEFKDVEFYYSKTEPILNNFNLKVKARQRVALVGETGSGKSTLVNLVCRFYEPVNGSIMIDGVDYRERSIGWLHHNLGYVLQSPHLFSGSIKENIRYGKLDASDEEIIEAAKLVNAHDFIMSFEDGYESDVGEGGGRLSTGQKQLISFARAMISNPSIFVLDEATSSIDTETEMIIQHAIEHVLKDKTSFIIAHRLSTIVSCDLILVMKHGEIIESGNHQELLDLKGYYHSLYMNQFKEEQEDLGFEAVEA